MANISEVSKIYLVDDDRVVCHSLSLILRKYGYEVEVFNSAEDYLEQYDDAHIGVLLVDQNMPGMTGLELQKILNDKQTKLDIIFITAVYDAVCDLAINNGAKFVCEKPFDPKELVDLLKEGTNLH